MGLFDKPRPINEAGQFEWPEDWSDYGSLSDLFDGRVFRLLAVRVRKANTSYGKNNAVDFALELIGHSEPTCYSGFSTGIAVMATNAEDSDFPVWCRIEYKDTGKGKPTTILVPLSDQEAAETGAASNLDDDIPF